MRSGSAGEIVTRHSPASELNSRSPSGPGIVNVSTRSGEVGCCAVNETPPTVSARSPEPIHVIAKAPGGGTHNAGSPSDGKACDAFTAPVTVTSAVPIVKPDSASGSTVGAGDSVISTGAPVLAGSGNEASSSRPQAGTTSANATTAVTAVAFRTDPPPRALTVPPASIAAMLDRALVEEVLAAARRRGGAFAEVFVEETTGTSIRLDDGKVEELTTGLDRGAGVRVTHGTSYGYAFSNRLDREALLEAADAASAALRDDDPGSIVDLRMLEGPVTNAVERPAAGVAASDKVAWLRAVDDAARAYSPEVVQVVGVYGDSLQRRLIATSDGRWVTEDRPRIRIFAQVVAKRGDTIQTGHHGPAACAGVEFIDANPPEQTATVAAKRAVTMLDSIPAPAGEMTVVLAPGMGGVLFHEAVGHPLEADAIDKEASVYRGLVGTKCASELINGVDDATIANGWGSFTFDDEATAAQRTVLFTDGVLQSFLYDRLRADKQGVESTGNGRRQSYASPPVVRMTNTNILNGDSKPEHVLADTPSGVYVTALGGGQVNPATGDFVFGVSEGYLIENGKATTPVRGANLIGRAIEVMSAVDAVADDFDTWEGVCGKDGQSAPVGSGSPTLRISRITVGGTGA